MDVGVYKISEISNDQIIVKVRARESFTLECEEFVRYEATLSWLEKAMEKEGLKVRIFMMGRVASVGASFLGGFTGLAGLGAGLAIAAHNIATWSPDYEIGKSPLTTTLYVKYKK